MTLRRSTNDSTLHPNVDLPPGTVHVWRLDITFALKDYATWWSYLSPDEQARAQRFLHESVRDQFVVSHGVLRGVLSLYAGIAPSALAFENDPHGKPMLVGDARDALQFNLSHSGDMALIGLARARPIGVDIERIHEVNTLAQIADRYFTPAEAATIRSLPPGRSHAAFFRCWVRKEAVVKALGHGISFGLNQFEVGCEGRDDPAIVGINIPGDSRRWGLAMLPTPREYVGAVVAAGDDWTLKSRVWPPGHAAGAPESQ